MEKNRVYLSPGIMTKLAFDHGYMDELLQTTVSVMSQDGGETDNELLDSDTEALEHGDGVFWYLFTSTHGDIYITGDVETGNIHIMLQHEFDEMDQLDFADILSMPPEAFI